MADPKLTLTLAAKDAASKEINKVTNALDGTSKASGGLGGKLGTAGAAVGGFAKVAAAAAVGGVGLLAVGLGFAAKQAIAEEESIARLDAALKANIPSWDGNKAAVDALITKMEGLAFSDDAAREAMATLIVPTQDVTKATELMAVAADLARLKNIDLNTAAEIVGKVYAGNTGILGRYGIQLEEGATATQALATIQAAAAGQAEAYGNTNKAAFEKFSIALNNIVEDVGTALLPLLGQVATFLNETLIPAVKGIVANIQKWVTENKPFIDQIRDLVSNLLAPFKTGLEAIVKVFTDFGPLPAIIGAVTVAVFALSAAVRANPIIAIASAIILAIGLLVEAWNRDFGGMRTTITKFFEAIKPITDGIGEAFKAIQDAINALIPPIRTVIELAQKAIDLILTLARLNGPGKEQQQAAYDAWKKANPGQTLPGAEAAGLRAIGGSVTGGKPYIVGERGPELFVPQSAGRVVTGSGGGIGSVSIVINGAGQNANEIARQVIHALERRMTQQGTSSLVRR